MDDAEFVVWEAIATHTDPDQVRQQLFGPDGLLLRYLRSQRSGASTDADTSQSIDKILGQISALRFDEFKIKEYADWKRVRAAIEHENLLVNHRLTWLLTSQIFLLAGFGVVFTASIQSWTQVAVAQLNTRSPAVTDLHAVPHAEQLRWVLTIVCAVGILMCLSVYRFLFVAENQLADLDDWWHNKRCGRPRNDHHPLLQGRKVGLCDVFLRNRDIPFWLSLAWCGLLGVVTTMGAFPSTYFRIGALALFAALVVFVRFVETLTDRPVSELERQSTRSPCKEWKRRIIHSSSHVIDRMTQVTRDRVPWLYRVIQEAIERSRLGCQRRRLRDDGPSQEPPNADYHE
jgi:hypothetical protein